MTQIRDFVRVPKEASQNANRLCDHRGRPSLLSGVLLESSSKLAISGIWSGGHNEKRRLNKLRRRLKRSVGAPGGRSCRLWVLPRFQGESCLNIRSSFSPFSRGRHVRHQAQDRYPNRRRRFVLKSFCASKVWPRATQNKPRTSFRIRATSPFGLMPPFRRNRS